MTKKRFNNRRFSRISIFVLVQSGILIGSFLIHILSRISIISFYSLLILFTICSAMILEMLLLLIYNLFKSTNKDKVFTLFMILLFSGVFSLLTFCASSYYMDVPYAIKGNYKVIEGKCTYVYAYRGRTAHLDITVENIEFDVSLGYEGSIRKGEYYKVEYLPNTKEVMAIYHK